MAMEEFSEPVEGKKEENSFELRLYVAGITPRSLKAIKNLKKLLAEYQSDYNLEIIDIYQSPIIAKEGQIIAAPTLIREFPLPVRKFIGDMSEINKLILGLDLKLKKKRSKR